MAAENKTNKNSFSLDWLIGGVLSKLGDTFDRLTGRSWNPSSSLATSKLIEKLKFLLDSEVRELDDEGKFVPHIIKLKIQWNKFSTDSEEGLKKLEHELHAAAIDHINDKLYHTYAPLEIEIKTDYFTEGVRMLASYGKFSDEEEDEVAINVTIPNLRTEGLLKDNKITVNLSEEEIKIQPKMDVFIANFILNGNSKEVELDFTEKKRFSVGRFKENNLSIPDQSVSKVHASLVLNNDKQLMVADTGSTNGTFINDERIAYGKAFPVEDGAKVKFGTIEVVFNKLEVIEDLPEEIEESELMPTQAVSNLNGNEVSQLKPIESPVDHSNERVPELNPTMAEIQPEETEIKSLENEIQETFQNSNQTINEQKPVENEVDEDEKESINHTDNEIKPQTETEEDKKSQQININETQDWEI